MLYFWVCVSGYRNQSCVLGETTKPRGGAPGMVPRVLFLKTDFSVYFLSIYDNLMSHHVPGPPDYDVVMTEQVSGQNEPKMLGQHKPQPLITKLNFIKH